MKIRYGFISNSSSTSFCIYGMSFEEDDLFEIARKLNGGEALIKDKENDIDLNLDQEDDCYTSEITQFIESLITPLTIHSIYDDIFYIGRSFTTIRDDETGKQFKKSTEQKLKEILKKEIIDCNIIEEAGRDG